MSLWTQIYKDDFDNNTVDLSAYDATSGHVTPTESGTLLKLSVPGGQIMRDVPFFNEHYGLYENGQVVNADEASGYGTSDLGVYRFEWKFKGVSNISGTDGNGWLYADSAIGEGQTGSPITNQSRKARFWVGYNGTDWRIGFTRLLATYTVEDYNEIFTPSDPANMNILFRYYYNRMDKQYWYLEDEDILLPPRTGGASYTNAMVFSLDDGSSWTTMAINPTGIAADTDAPGVQVHTSTSSAYPTFDAEWDYMKIEKIDRDTVSSATPAAGRKIAVRTERRSMTSTARINSVFLLEDDNWIAMNPAPTLPTHMSNFGLWGDTNPANSYLIAAGNGAGGNYAQHFESGGWIQRSFPAGVLADQIGGVAENNVFAVGVSGNSYVFNWDSATWTTDETIATGTSKPSDIFASPADDGELWLATNTLLYHRDSGGTWTDITSQLSSIMDDVYCVWGTAANNLYVGGSTTAGRSRIAKWNGTVWTTIYTNDAATYNAILGIFGVDANNIWAFMDNYSDTGQDYHRVLYWNGTSWTEQELPKAEVDTHIQDIRGFGTSANELVITGAGDVNGDTTRDFGASIWMHDGDGTWTRQDQHDNLYDWFEAAVFIYKTETNPPTISGQNPSNGSTDIDTDTSISFSLADDTQVMLDSIIVTVHGDTVFQNSAFAAGWTSSTAVINGSNGYDFTLIHDDDFPGLEDILVTVYAEDQSVNILDTSWSFTTGVELNAPQVINQSPSDAEQNVALTSTISFAVTDDTDVAQASLRVYFDDMLLYNGTSFSAGWTDSTIVANVFHGYDIELIPDELFNPNKTHTVRVIAEDTMPIPNQVDTSWSFATILQGLATYLHHEITIEAEGVDPVTGLPVFTTVGTAEQIRPINTWNQFDEHGNTVSLPRIRGEKNAPYRRRIKDTMVKQANASYRGMVHGITRELGLSLFDAISINPMTGDDGQFQAPDPYIAFDGAYMLLYSDFRNNALDWAVDRFQPGGNFEHVGRLVDMVNTTTAFEAELLAGVDPYTRSMAILNQSNRNQVNIEFLPQSTHFRLRHGWLVPGSVFFSNRNLFRTEMATKNDVTTSGQYHVDYTQGIITSARVPAPRSYVRYRYIQYPFRAVASPVIVHDINRETFRVKMFEQILSDTGELVHGLPTELGVDIINELMSVNPMYWGV